MMISMRRVAFLFTYIGVLFIGAVLASEFWLLPVVGVVAIVLLTVCVINRVFAWVVYFFAITANGLVFTAGFGTLRPELLALPVLLIIVLQERTRTGSGGHTSQYRPLVFASVVWLSVTLLSSAFVAPERLRSLWICLQIVAAVGTYFALSGSGRKEQFIRIGSAILTLVALLSILCYLLTRFAGINLPFVYGVAADGRLIGLSFEVNVFAAQCVGWLAVLFANRAVHVKFLYPIIAILSVAIMLGGTRAAWVALALLAFLTLVESFRVGNLSHSLFLCGAAVSAFSYVLLTGGDAENTDDFAWRVSNILNVSQGTGAYRIDIYTLALSDINTLSRWLFGSGANSFSQYHAIDATGTGAPYLSSVWAAVLYDSGLLGFLAFIALICGCVLRSSGRRVALVIPFTLLLCATTTNIVWFAFTWVYIALIPIEIEDEVRDVDSAPLRSRSTEDLSHQGVTGR